MDGRRRRARHAGNPRAFFQHGHPGAGGAAQGGHPALPGDYFGALTRTESS